MPNRYMTRNKALYQRPMKDRRANRPMKRAVTREFLTRTNKVLVKRIDKPKVNLTERLNHSIEKIPSTFEVVVDCSHNVCIMRNKCIKP